MQRKCSCCGNVKWPMAQVWRTFNLAKTDQKTKRQKWEMWNDQLRCGALSIWLSSTLSLPATPASEVSLSRTTKSKEIWRKSHLWQKKQSYWSKNCLMWAFQSIVISDSWWLDWQPGPSSFSTLTSTSGTTSSSRDTRSSQKLDPDLLQISIGPQDIQDCATEPNPCVQCTCVWKGLCVQLSFTSKSFVAIITPCGSDSLFKWNSVRGFCGGRDKGFILWHWPVLTWQKS